MPSKTIVIVPRSVLPEAFAGTVNTQTAWPPTNLSDFGWTLLAPALATQSTRPLTIAAPVSLLVAAIRTVNVLPAFGDVGAVFNDLNTTRAGATFTSYE